MWSSSNRSWSYRRTHRLRPQAKAGSTPGGYDPLDDRPHVVVGRRGPDRRTEARRAGGQELAQVRTPVDGVGADVEVVPPPERAFGGMDERLVHIQDQEDRAVRLHHSRCPGVTRRSPIGHPVHPRGGIMARPGGPATIARRTAAITEIPSLLTRFAARGLGGRRRALGSHRRSRVECRDRRPSRRRRR